MHALAENNLTMLIGSTANLTFCEQTTCENFLFQV